jgi:hypothetical protein
LSYLDTGFNLKLPAWICFKRSPLPETVGGLGIVGGGPIAPREGGGGSFIYF